MKNKTVKLGSIVVQKEKKGVTLHVTPTLHEDGLQRFVSSKRFQKVKGDGRELLKEGQEQVLDIISFSKLLEGSRFWMQQGNKFRLVKKIAPKLVRNCETDEVRPAEAKDPCLVPQSVNYSFTIKQSPERATTMAKAKAAAKKAAPKKAATKKAAPKKAEEKKGPGKIEQIIALHKKGKTNPEIVEAGFNKTTVSIQVSKYKKDPKAFDKK